MISVVAGRGPSRRRWARAIGVKMIVPWALGMIQCSAASSAPHALPPRAEQRGSNLVSIPRGIFWMGMKNVPFHDDEPWHEVQVNAFHMDATEVTVVEYERCVQAERCVPAGTASEGRVGPDDFKAFFRQFCNAGRAGRDNHPINCVSWNDARDFCEWAGKRLPTEEEWEYAARGTDGRNYPWGNEEADARRLNGCDAACVAFGRSLGAPWRSHFTWTDGYAATAPVASFPRGRSPFGLYDMAGNVDEWTASAYSEPEGGSTERRTVRGGAWSDDRGFAAANREGVRPSKKSCGLGFRCAR